MPSKKSTWTGLRLMLRPTIGRWLLSIGRWGKTASRGTLSGWWLVELLKFAKDFGYLMRGIGIGLSLYAIFRVVWKSAFAVRSATAGLKHSVDLSSGIELQVGVTDSNWKLLYPHIAEPCNCQ